MKLIRTTRRLNFKKLGEIREEGLGKKKEIKDFPSCFLVNRVLH